MARTLLVGQSVLYDGDPLRDLTLAAFLEKFVQKKAKVRLGCLGGVMCGLVWAATMHAVGKIQALRQGRI